MSYARVISNIKRNEGGKTVVRLIKGKLSCSRIKSQDDLTKMNNVIGVYDSHVPASWITDDLDSVGFSES
ncbi:hypothetical protein UFOVP26_125 [uncultured Caudovirales phage]|uniref:Uncharacterized protein n=1 Tax=uncultured Caudovirales phage TaxID=2100421 RepID=A0A6J5KRU4_9CAUD|nr:hypothetical protein UFOVP26_125 [uncultured Caudovirales phage]CAB4123982.1 hypothetical protein UFOVP44_110 [uncultured Caudovirales phage]CAB5219565.1 hypothetical protein UFOVP220_101 [uncultured Caudovirales phage]